MRYRALVIIPGTEIPGAAKSAREQHHINLMHTQLRQWDSTVPVPPYYDPSYDTDAVYSKLLQRTTVLADKVNIDDPLEVMNYIGKASCHVFYTSIPNDDKKMREHRKKEYEKEIAPYKKAHKKIPPEIEEKYRADITEPVPAPKTKLYAYSFANPDGMFKKYSYPIETVYNINVSASKLVNRNYGTSHDILLYGDLDYEATFLPNVVFCNGEIFESYSDESEGGDPEEIRHWLEEEKCVERKDYVALIECEI